ncbi:MaoC family dehydratase [Dermatobacter hominis]|uniref:MaoC family dehydratase n=1 Tax=Dermatobacter hominis TaxID=2884263 RepID=UPI001D0F5FA3|nr:MaoC family dehydratase [Dermatobacter hominis]UDY34827.1 MaoC family dehydratase [Dermatobacter hominis]
MTTVAEPAALLDMVGADLGSTDWVDVTQDRVNEFAEATGDFQWIHVDVERATAESPFGGPIAHGYLTLSMVNLFLPELLTVEAFSMGVNVGLDKVRFPAPVPVGSRVRARGEVVAASEEKGGVQVTVRVTVERDLAGEGTPDAKPACVADTVSRFFP